MQYEELQIKIMEWKEIFEEVYQVNLVDKDKENVFSFIFHTLGREEYKALLSDDIDEVQFQEILCNHAILYPEEFDYSNGLAGIPEVLADTIIETSGLHLGQAKQILDYFREQMMIYDYQADCIIHEAFPEFSIDDIQSWSNKRTMYYLSRAEWILTNLKGVPLIPLDQQVAEDMQAMESIQQAEQQYDYNFNNQDGAAPAVPQEEMYPEFQQQYDGEMDEDYDPFAPEEWGEQPPQPTPIPAKPAPAAASQEIQSESELMAMLANQEAQHGRKVTTPTSDGTVTYPEMGWFQHEEELKGDFD